MKKQTAGTEYLRDESYFEGNADEMGFAETKEDIEELLKECDHLTVQGSKTGISGACVPLNGNILNMSRFKSEPVIGNDEEGTYIDILPGTTFEEVEAFLRRREAGKYYLPIEPTEKTASVGGAVATNAQGPSPLHSYNIAEYILEADVFFPAFGHMTIKKNEYVFAENGKLDLGDGKTLELDMLSEEECEKTPVKLLTAKPGDDFLNILVGSEGMLCIFERLRFRLLKMPQSNWKFLCFPPNEEKGFELIKDVLDEKNDFVKNGLCAVDYMDSESVNCVKKRIGLSDKYAQIPELPTADTPAVMIYVSGEEDIYDVLEELQELFENAEVAEENIWAADSEDESVIIKTFRHAAPECVNGIIEENRKNCGKIRKITLDIQFRINESDVFDFEKVRKILKENCDDIVFAYTIHAGRNVYHIDLLPENENEFEKALKIKEKLIEKFVEMNVLFGVENGCGKGKYDGLECYISEKQKNMMREIKMFCDQCNVLNSDNFPMFDHA